MTMNWLTKLLALGPIFFGALFAGPIAAAVLEAAHIGLPLGLPALPVTCAVGFAWGCLAMKRSRWL